MATYTFRIMNGRCRMEHDALINASELGRFTAQKMLVWAPISSAIDAYIANSIIGWMEHAAGRTGIRRLPASVRATLMSGAYIADISRDVDNDVNRGLGLIWKSDIVRIPDCAPRTNIIGDDHFRLALTKLFRSVGVSDKHSLGRKVNWSQIWVDACAFRFLEQYAKSLSRR